VSSSTPTTATERSSNARRRRRSSLTSEKPSGQSSEASRPTPKHVVTICSVCELPWEDHGDDPTLETCVRLLAQELKKRQAPTWVYPISGWWCYSCRQWVYGYHTCFGVQPWTVKYGSNGTWTSGALKSQGQINANSTLVQAAESSGLMENINELKTCLSSTTPT
jgi:hypothetical protein